VALSHLLPIGVGAGVVAFLFAMLAGSSSRGWSAGRGWGGGFGAAWAVVLAAAALEAVAVVAVAVSAAVAVVSVAAALRGAGDANQPPDPSCCGDSLANAHAVPRRDLGCDRASHRPCREDACRRNSFRHRDGVDAAAYSEPHGARARALEVFAHLGVWDTEHNNGVLIYVQLADRDVEIVADRGFQGRVSLAEWEAVCRLMEEHFRAGRFKEGSIAGVDAIGDLLARHFPPNLKTPARSHNQLPDRPTLL